MTALKSGSDVVRHVKDKYLPGAIASVKTNSHMNSLNGEVTISQENVNTLITAFIDYSIAQDPTTFGSMRVMSILEALTSAACTFCPSALQITGLQIPRDEVDAFVVDYINMVGCYGGRDYALYTCDLN
jgi:hypothetical protein